MSASRRKVLIALSTIGGYEPDPLKPLYQAGFEVVLNPYRRKLTADEVKALGRECVGIVAGLEPLTKDVLESLPQLRCISRAGIGVDNIDLTQASAQGIQICITAQAPIRSVAELTLGLLLDLFRQISKADRLIRAEKWNRLKGRQLAGKTIGIVGFGRIGKAVARLLQALDVVVIGSDPAANLPWCTSHGITAYPLPELLPRCDAICLHVSHQAASGPLIARGELALMRPTAFLVNMSRGGVVDESALLDALQEKRLAGAAMDVFEEEPYSGPLCRLDNVILSPHMGTFTQEAREAMEREAIDNLLKALGPAAVQ